MLTKPFGATGRDVPGLGQGSWNIPLRGSGADEAKRALRRGVELGMTHIDTAEMYGDGGSERVIGEAIRELPRDALFIVSKVVPSNASYAGTIAACEASLRRLGCDYLDGYLLHWRGSIPLRETLRAMERLVADGKIRALGVSNFDVDDLREAVGLLEREPLVCNQVLYHLGERSIEDHELVFCRENGIALVGYTPFGRGDYEDGPGVAVLERVAAQRAITVRQVILAFLTRDPIVFSIPKAATEPHVEENARAGDVRLDAAEIAAIDTAFPLRRRRGRFTVVVSAVDRAAIVAAAQAAGADAVRIAPARVLDATRVQLAAAFERGDLATWPYDDGYAARASDPATLLPGARSVICIAVAYALPPGVHERGRGRVSNYAWSSDYHARLRALLARVAASIDALAQAPVTAIACDTLPLAERAFAVAAGLGWVGKHTNVIAPGIGSFIFLGEIVTSLDLGADAPLRKTCGTCRRCVNVCPTGALRGDYTLDATRCISDLTQRKGAIPRALRPLIGDWVWGCDLCQDVCPPTVRGRSGSPAFAPLDDQTRAPDLLALLELSAAEFKRRYAVTAMGWRGAAILRRNAAVALGNGLDRAAVPALGRALAGDRSAMVRGHAAWALGHIGSPSARTRLAAASADEADSWVRAEIAAALEPAANANAL